MPSSDSQELLSEGLMAEITYTKKNRQSPTSYKIDEWIGLLPKLKATDRDRCSALITKYFDVKKETIEDAISPDKDEESKKSTIKEVLELLEKENIVFFHDTNDDAYILRPEVPFHAISTKSREFRQFIGRLAWEKFGKALSNESLNTILNTVEGKCVFDGETIELHVRIAWHDGNIYHDAGDGKIVEITAQGWGLTVDSPVFFKRFRHQLRYLQHFPETFRQVDTKQFKTLMLKFLNINEADDKNGTILLLVWIICSFIPGFPHPVLCFHGSAGCGKTTMQEFCKELVDPSATKEEGPPSNEEDFNLLLAQNWLVIIGNLTELHGWLSNAICRACTGGTRTKRELYTDTNTIISSYERVLALNGINIVVESPDLLERSIIIRPPDISADQGKRKEEKVYWADFNRDKTKILEGIYQTVSKTLANYPDVKYDNPPRMADFAKWGTAIAQALGYKENEFKDAYEANIVQQHDEALDASPVAIALIELMSETMGLNEINETPSRLLTQLEIKAKKLGLNTKQKPWPKNSNWLWKRLSEVQGDLKSKGIKLSRDSTGTNRVITIKK